MNYLKRIGRLVAICICAVCVGIIPITAHAMEVSDKQIQPRMCLSEHPFGTIKRAMGATYFLLKGMRKVAGGFALFCLGYNLERAKNLLGFHKMMELMEQA